MSERAKPRFQFHLATAVAMTFLAGGMIWMNLLSFECDGPFKPACHPKLSIQIPNSKVPIAASTPVDVVWFNQGWPITYRQYYWAKPPIDAQTAWVLGVNGFTLYADCGVGLVIVFAFGAAIEWMNRRKR